MVRINRRQALACGAFGSPLIGAHAEEASDEPDAELSDIVGAALKSWDVPGVAVGIVRKGQVTYLAGHGVKKRGDTEPVTPDTLFGIASCTKAFTTTAMAMLVAQGRMNWDAPVRQYLDYFRLADPSADRLVTLRDLVCHRSGLGSHDLLWYRASWSPREAVRRIAHLAPDLQFRSSFQYQSTMVAAAGYALEAALGKDATWEGFVRRRILEPLQMNRTFCTAAEARKSAAADLAMPHRRDRTGAIRPVAWYETEWADPAGSIVSCARDLCKWAAFHLRRGKVVRDGREVALVPEQALDETHAPQNIIPLHGIDRKLQPLTDHMTYCMGWVRQDYRGQLLLSHGGTIDGFRTHLTLVPKEQLGIVLLNNLNGTDMNLALSNTLVDYHLKSPRRDWNAELGEVARERDDAVKWQREEREKRRIPGAKQSREDAAYVGTYVEPVFGEAKVKLEDGKLFWEWSTFKCPLEHYHFDTFVAKNEIINDPFVNFSLGLDGSVVTLHAVNRYFLRAPGK